MAKTAREEINEELEEFESDLKSSADDEFEDLENSLDLEDEQDPVEKDEDTAEPSKEGDVVETEEPVEGEEKDADASDQTEVEYVTLPDDNDAFGDLAGKKVTVEQLQEAKLLQKLATWGHQARHLTKRSQEELEEAKKMREVLEEQLKLQKDNLEKANQAPPVAPDKAAEELVQAYGAGIQALGEAGAIEPTFFETYPKLAAQLEHRFQNAAQFGNALVDTISNLLEGHERRTEAEIQESTQARLDSVMDEAAGSNELFAGLKDSAARKEFLSWAADEKSGLQWVEKSLDEVTPADVTASYLLYVHQNPDKFQAPSKGNGKDKEAERRLAGGGGHGSKGGKKPKLDEFQQFEQELKESRSSDQF